MDDEDYELVSQYTWQATHFPHHWSYYATSFNRKHKPTTIYMHRLIVNALQGVGVDHINRDALDNRRSNLRLCTQSQNNANQKLNVRNTSGFKGVSWHIRHERWKSYITVKKIKIHLGYFYTPLEAALAYDEAARKYHGEFAATNQRLGLLPSVLLEA
ncbi:MAG: HNH endonuclease [Anaerolineae bacterium]